MRKTFRYRAYGNVEALANLDRWLGLCRNLYNCALEQRRDARGYWRHRITCYGQINELPRLKESLPEYKDVGSQCLEEVLERLDKAFVGFFRRVKNGGMPGYPRFKGKDRYNSFTLKKSGWRMEENRLFIRNVGALKLKLSRPIEGNIKTVTMCRTPTGKWHACFSCDNVPEKLLLRSGSTVGIDVGIKVFCVDSDGGWFDNPAFYQHEQKRLRLRQRRLCRRKKGSKRRQKGRVLVARSHEKVRNQRNDYLHKVANYYIKKYGYIYIEDLGIRNMVRNPHLSKSIQDSGWGLFFRMLSYKAEEAGRELSEVNPFNTSQVCSGCGEKVPKTLVVRIHCCPHCGLVMDRDENAARNISAAGQAVRAKTKEVALGVARESPDDIGSVNQHISPSYGSRVT